MGFEPMRPFLNDSFPNCYNNHSANSPIKSPVSFYELLELTTIVGRRFNWHAPLTRKRIFKFGVHSQNRTDVVWVAAIRLKPLGHVYVILLLIYA